MSEEREVPYDKRHNVEPANCIVEGNPVYCNDPKKAVEAYIKNHEETHCCTVESGKVTQWKLPDRARVQLRPAKNGTIFYYDSTKLPLD